MALSEHGVLIPLGESSHDLHFIVASKNVSKHVFSMKLIAGWWFQTWLLFSISYMGCHPKPIDELIFFKGVAQPPTR